MRRACLLIPLLTACAAGDLDGADDVEGAACAAPEDCAEDLVCEVKPGAAQRQCLRVCQLPTECPSTGQCDITPGAPFGYCAVAPPPQGMEPDAGGAVVGRNDGNPCTQDFECAGGRCLTEAEGFPGGYCTTLGCVRHGDCNGNDVACVAAEQNQCVALCRGMAECRGGYECAPVGDVGICRPTAG